jgi:hypothetical protein
VPPRLVWLQPPVAGEGAGQQHQREPPLRIPVPADRQSPVARQPRQRPLDPPAMPPKPGRGLDAAPGDPRGDPTAPQPGTVAGAVVALVGVDLAGPSAPLTRRRAHRGRSSTIACSMVTSGRLAAVTAAVSGSPRPSQTSWILDPGLPRSTGFAPTWSPPTFGAHAGRVHAGARPVQPALLAEPVEDLQVQLLEHARLGPFGKATPSGRRRAAAQFFGWQQPPWGGGARHIDDRGEAVAVGDGAVPAALGWPGREWQQRLDQPPQLVGGRACQRASS